MVQALQTAKKYSLRLIMLVFAGLAIVGTVQLSSQEYVEAAGPNQQGGAAIWQDVTEATIQRRNLSGERLIFPSTYRLVTANLSALDGLLAQAPAEDSLTAAGRDLIITLPLPDGTNQQFRIAEYQMMEPDLAAQLPDVKTYLGWGIDDPAATVRLDRTPAGFHGMILGAGETVYIDPYTNRDTTHYLSYYARDYVNHWGKLRLDVGAIEPADGEDHDHAAENHAAESVVRQAAPPTGPDLRTYRLAMAATGEYTQFHGGTVVQAQAAIVTSMNRVNGVYERDVSVRMTLVNNSSIVYTNGSTDPYTNSSGGAMLGQNQANLDAVIGTGNYDIGHVFSTGGGGVASLGSVCSSFSKARGVTGLFAPVGDAFDIDFVAHEIGHQFDATHTFNASGPGACGGGNRTSSTAYEPGGGTTIMAYAGICGSQNVQSNSDDHFHGASLDQISSFIADSFGGGSCGTVTTTGNNAPTVNAGSNFTIPKQTPFQLTGSATDAQALTYGWEEFDLGTAVSGGSLPNTDTAAERPIFRSFSPVAEAIRIFPQLTNILNGTYQNNGESLPDRSRTMTFRLTARDGLGGVNNDSMTVTVDDGSGPFRVTQPSGNPIWEPGTQETATWDVAGTTAAPVSCANVNLLLSTDNGATFSETLVTGTPNDGSQAVFVPILKAEDSYLKVECAGNIFFDISSKFRVCVPETGNPNICSNNLPQVPILSLTKLASSSAVTHSQILTYTLVVRNSGNLSATNLLITDTVPNDTAYLFGSASGSGTSVFTIPGSIITWTTGLTLPPSQSLTETFSVQVDAGAALGTQISNTAYVSATNVRAPRASNTHIATVGDVQMKDIYLPVVLK